MRIGVQITTSEAPPATSNLYNTATAFMVGLGDTGIVGTPVSCRTINDVGNMIGARSATNQTLYDSADVYFREQGSFLYISRVVGPTTALSTLTLNDALASPKPTVVINALYPGSAPNAYTAAVAQQTVTTFTASTATSTALTAISSIANLAPGTLITGAGVAAGTYIVSVTGSTAVLSTATTATASGVTITPYTFTVTITDPSGQFATEVHGPFTNTAALYADTSSQMVTFSQSAGSGFTVNSPAVLAATPLAGGTDNRGSATLSNWTNALNAIPRKLGPGQVSAPGQTNTTLNGIWSALDLHASLKNRVAIKDCDDGQSAATIIGNVGSYGTAATASYGEFHAGNLIVPGIAVGTTRSVPPSAVVSALCARADATGNPDQPPAGMGFPLQYVSAFTGPMGNPLYNQADIDSLNLAGINTWNLLFNVRQNYGAVTPVLQTVDPIYWWFAHSRLRMALVALFEIIAQPFVFSVLDGQGHDIAAFSGDLAVALKKLADIGAISTLAPDGSQDQGFVVDTSPNTPTTLGNGQLLANVSFRPSPGAQLVAIQLIAVPTTASL